MKKTVRIVLAILGCLLTTCVPAIGKATNELKDVSDLQKDNAGLVITIIFMCVYAIVFTIITILLAIKMRKDEKSYTARIEQAEKEYKEAEKKHKDELKKILNGSIATIQKYEGEIIQREEQINELSLVVERLKADLEQEQLKANLEQEKLKAKLEQEQLQYYFLSSIYDRLLELDTDLNEIIADEVDKAIETVLEEDIYKDYQKCLEEAHMWLSVLTEKQRKMMKTSLLDMARVHEIVENNQPN